MIPGLVSQPPVVDIALLDRAVHGEEEAIDRLLREAVYPIVNLALRRAAGPTVEQLEDLKQDAVLRVIRFLPTSRAQSAGEFRKWCWRIALRVAADAQRVARRSPAARARELREDLPAVGGATAGNDPTIRPLLSMLRDEISHMQPSAGELLELRFGCGKTWGQVAKDLGIAPTAAKRRYQRILERLRARMRTSIAHLPDRTRARLARRMAT